MTQPTPAADIAANLTRDCEHAADVADLALAAFASAKEKAEKLADQDDHQDSDGGLQMGNNLSLAAGLLTSIGEELTKLALGWNSGSLYNRPARVERDPENVH